jgi:Outer membrane protein beta-barrel domain
MKKTTIILLSLLLGAPTFFAKAQETSTSPGHRWIIKTGVTRSLLNCGPLVMFDDTRPSGINGYAWKISPFQTNFQVEAGREWRLGRMWRATTGLGYRRYGGIVKANPSSPDYENHLHYLNAVGLMRFMILPEYRVCPYLVGGARLGYLLSGTRTEATERELYRGQPFRTFDFVPAIGGGLDFQLFDLKQHVFIEVEYSIGASNVVGPAPRNHNSNIYNRAVAFTVGLTF